MRPETRRIALSWLALLVLPLLVALSPLAGCVGGSRLVTDATSPPLSAEQRLLRTCEAYPPLLKSLAALNAAGKIDASDAAQIDEARRGLRAACIGAIADPMTALTLAEARLESLIFIRQSAYQE